MYSVVRWARHYCSTRGPMIWLSNEASNTLIAITSIVALILSVVSLIWQWSTRRFRIKVAHVIQEELKLIGATPTTDGALMRTYTLMAHVYNAGERPIYLKDAAIVYNFNQKIATRFSWRTQHLDRKLDLYFLEEKRSTNELAPSRSCLISIPLEEYKLDLVMRGFVRWLPVRIYVEDELGHRYYSEYFQLAIDRVGIYTAV